MSTFTYDEPFVNTDAFEDSLDFGQGYERLTFWTTHEGRSLSDVTTWPHVRFPTVGVQQIVNAIREQMAQKTWANVTFDKQEPELIKLMTALANERIPKDHHWREKMEREIPDQYRPRNKAESDNFDYWTKTGLRVQSKADRYCFGFQKRYSGNIAFEFKSNGKDSGFKNEHDVFVMSTPNRFGDPILQFYHDTLQLRDYMEPWRVLYTHRMGNFDACRGTLLYMPHYLVTLAPADDEPF
jgi:hypothetical protein